MKKKKPLLSDDFLNEIANELNKQYDSPQKEEHHVQSDNSIE